MKKDNVFEEIVKIDKEKFEDAIDKAFDKKKAHIKLDGFREGKVPRDVYLWMLLIYFYQMLTMKL